MDIIVKLPDPKFQIGDVVRIPLEANDKHIYLSIINILGRGSWKMNVHENLIRAFWDNYLDNEYLDYFCVVQVVTTIIRPLHLCGLEHA